MTKFYAGDTVTIKGNNLIYHIKAISQNGQVAFLRAGWPDNPGKRYVTEDTKNLKKLEATP